MFKVFIKYNRDTGIITDINSDLFIKVSDGWQEIDEGMGDKFAYAQLYYLPKGLMTDGKYNYKYLLSEIIENE